MASLHFDSNPNRRELHFNSSPPVCGRDPTLFFWGDELYRIVLTEHGKEIDYTPEGWDHIKTTYLPLITRLIEEMQAAPPAGHNAVQNATRFHYDPTNQALSYGDTARSDTQRISALEVANNIAALPPGHVKPAVPDLFHHRMAASTREIFESRSKKGFHPPLSEKAQESTAQKLQQANKGGNYFNNLDETDVQNSLVALQAARPNEFEVMEPISEDDAQIIPKLFAHIGGRNLANLNQLFLIPIRLNTGSFVYMFIDFHSRVVRSFGEEAGDFPLPNNQLSSNRLHSIRDALTRHFALPMNQSFHYPMGNQMGQISPHHHWPDFQNGFIRLQFIKQLLEERRRLEHWNTNQHQSAYLLNQATEQTLLEVAQDPNIRRHLR